jgi:cytochrome c oxidase subunit III
MQDIMMAKESTQRRKIHPKKFAMWIAIGSIIMMFGGLTSGYIVRKSQGNWETFKLPVEFYISTIVILLSSATLMLALRSFKQRKMVLHRNMVSLTFILGIAFAVLQYIGFKELFYNYNMKWANNVAFQYLIVIVLVHALHIIGGVVALLILFMQTYSRKVKTYSTTALEIVSTYWHFVDILWIYLFIFFLMNR